MNKLLKIIIIEVIVGAVALLGYGVFFLDSNDWISGVGLALIIFLTLGFVVATLITAFILKLFRKKSDINFEPPYNLYGLKFWIIVIILFILFVATLPYTVVWIDSLFIFGMTPENPPLDVIIIPK